jgi:hypothetical protein
MQDKILKLIEITNPRTVSRIIKNDSDLKTWVDSNSAPGNNFSKKIYDSLYPNNDVCKLGNFKKFKSLTEGYSFCNRANKCQCAKEKVSQSVSNTKQEFSKKKKNEIQYKREITNLSKYGVTNAGQSKYAKEQHQKYYATIPKKNKLASNKTLLSHSYNKLINKLKLLDISMLTEENQYKGVSNQIYYDFKCNKCDYLFSTYIDNGHTPECKVCYPAIPAYVSNAELEVKKYVESLIPELIVVSSNKTIISPYELDIVIPDLKLAIEYCGLYWHSSAQGKNINYHYDKMIKTNNQGYRLITIFEDEWINKKEIVKSRLQNILKKSKRTYARKLEIKEISGNLARAFLNKTHIQGYSSSSINVALYNNNEIVAIMTFGKPRYNSNYDVELIRYSSKGTVVGGASKLLSYYVKKYNPKNIISYCDMRWGTGDMYEAIGMTKIKQSRQGYSYTDFKSRSHRSNFTKNKLLKNKNTIGDSEEELANSIGWYKIGDCGNSVYVLEL